MTSADLQSSFLASTGTAWREFLAEPAAYTHGAWLAACFGGALDARFCGQLASTARLRGRLSALITRHYALPPWTEAQSCHEADRAIAMLPGDHIDELARRSGAIYWAGSIAKAILAHEVEAFHNCLGRNLCTFALAQRDLAGPAQELETPDSLSLRVLADGWRCVGAWRQGLPESVGRRVLLKLDPNTQLEFSPGSPFEILRANDAALWLEGYRFLAEVKSVRAAECARGYAEGKAAGAAEAALVINDAVVKVDRYLASLDQQIAALAMKIVRRVLGELDAADLIARAATQALTDFRREKNLKVTVHPEAVVRVRAALASHLREAGLALSLTVEADPALSKEGCVVASDFAVIDASIEAQLDALAKAVSTAAVERRGNED
jgi:type III secretion protein L